MWRLAPICLPCPTTSASKHTPERSIKTEGGDKKAFSRPAALPSPRARLHHRRRHHVNARGSYSLALAIRERTLYWKHDKRRGSCGGGGGHYDNRKGERGGASERENEGKKAPATVAAIIIFSNSFIGIATRS